MSLAALPGIASAAEGQAGFTGDRQRVYVALVAAVGAASNTQVKPSEADEAVRAFAAWYSEQVPETQGAVDNTLDSLESAPADGPFSTLDRRRRLEFLRDASGASVRGESRSEPAASDLELRALSATAIGFANYAFYPTDVQPTGQMDLQ